VFQPEPRSLKREALVAPPRRDPMRGIVPLCHEDREARGGVHLCDDLAVLGFGREDEREDPPPEPGGKAWAA
jgi:hypothetical protein